MPRFGGIGGEGGVKRFISSGQSVSSSRTFVAGREKAIIVENNAGGLLRGVCTTFMCFFHERSSSITTAACTYSGPRHMLLSRRLWRKAVTVSMGRMSFWCFRLSMKEMSLDVSRCEAWWLGDTWACFEPTNPELITPRGWSHSSCRQANAVGRRSGLPWSSRQTKSLAAGLTPWK